MVRDHTADVWEPKYAGIYRFVSLEIEYSKGKAKCVLPAERVL